VVLFESHEQFGSLRKFHRVEIFKGVNKIPIGVITGYSPSPYIVSIVSNEIPQAIMTYTGYVEKEFSLEQWELLD